MWHIQRGVPSPDLTSGSEASGTPEQVRERLEALVVMGATHLLLYPIVRSTDQVEALAEVVRLS